MPDSFLYFRRIRWIFLKLEIYAFFAAFEPIILASVEYQYPEQLKLSFRLYGNFSALLLSSFRTPQFWRISQNSYIDFTRASFFLKRKHLYSTLKVAIKSKGLKLQASQSRCMVNHFQLQASSRVDQGLRRGGDTHSLV